MPPTEKIDWIKILNGPRFLTPHGGCHIFEDKMICLSNQEAETILSRSHPKASPETRSETSSLADRIIEADLMEYDRSILASLILFLYTLADTNSDLRSSLQQLQQLQQEGANMTYYQFFERQLNIVSTLPVEPEVHEMAQIFREWIEESRPNFGLMTSHNFEANIFPVDDVFRLIALLMYTKFWIS